MHFFCLSAANLWHSPGKLIFAHLRLRSVCRSVVKYICHACQSPIKIKIKMYLFDYSLVIIFLFKFLPDFQHCFPFSFRNEEMIQNICRKSYACKEPIDTVTWHHVQQGWEQFGCPKDGDWSKACDDSWQDLVFWRQKLTHKHPLQGSRS